MHIKQESAQQSTVINATQHNCRNKIFNLFILQKKSISTNIVYYGTRRKNGELLSDKGSSKDYYNNICWAFDINKLLFVASSNKYICDK